MPTKAETEAKEEMRELFTAFMGRVAEKGAEGVTDEEYALMATYLSKMRTRTAQKVLKGQSAGVNPTLLGQLKGLRDQ